MDALLAVELIVTLITCIISDKVSRVKKLLKISGFLPQRLNRAWHCNSIRKELNLRNASPSLFNIGIIVLGYRDGNEFGLKYYLTEPHSACLKGSRLRAWLSIRRQRACLKIYFDGSSHGMPEGIALLHPDGNEVGGKSYLIKPFSGNGRDREWLPRRQRAWSKL